MALMTDRQLKAAINATPSSIVDGLDAAQIISEVYGCSVYLHIGAIFRPGAKDGEIGSSVKPILQQHCLAQGETALIRTKEAIQLDSSHAAIALPSSAVSMQGLLMTNPGHVDPGYEGPLHVTVINMGRKPFALVPGSRFLRALVFELKHPVDRPYSPPTPPSTPVTDELMDRLSPDFLSVDERAKAAAKREIDASVRANQLAQYGLPAAAAVLAALLTGLFGYLSGTQSLQRDVSDLKDVHAEKRITDLEVKLPTETEINQLRLAIEQIQNTQSNPKVDPKR